MKLTECREKNRTNEQIRAKKLFFPRNSSLVSTESMCVLLIVVFFSWKVSLPSGTFFLEKIRSRITSPYSVDCPWRGFLFLSFFKFRQRRLKRFSTRVSSWFTVYQTNNNSCKYFLYTIQYIFECTLEYIFKCHDFSFLPTLVQFCPEICMQWSQSMKLISISCLSWLLKKTLPFGFMHTCIW